MRKRYKAILRPCKIFNGEVRVFLTKGKSCTVDLSDKHLVEDFNWCFNSNGYAWRFKEGKHVYLHRELMGEIPGLVVDHIDRNKLNNRRSNLRHVTQNVNLRNTERCQRLGNPKSKYNGVTWSAAPKKKYSRWQVKLWFRGAMNHVASSSCEIEAAIAYDKKIVELFGEGDARLNFSKEERETFS